MLIGIISSIASNFGANVQKYSLMKEALKPLEQRRSYVMQKLWFIGECTSRWFHAMPKFTLPSAPTGLLLVILGSFGDFAALGFAAQSLITPGTRAGGVSVGRLAGDDALRRVPSSLRSWRRDHGRQCVLCTLLAEGKAQPLGALLPFP